MTFKNPKLSSIKQDVTTEIYKCYHICQFCRQRHYHWRGKFFVGPCQAPFVAGRCPDCRYKLKMAIQFQNQGRIISDNLRNLKGPGTNFV